MRLLLSSLGPFLAACFMIGCGGEAVGPAQAPPAPATAPAAPDEALLAGLRADQPATLRFVARAIAASGDVVTRRAASGRLVAQARWVASPAWRDQSRAKVQLANERAHLEPTPAQLEAQIDQYRNETLVRILAGMEEIGGPEIVAYCFALGEDEAAPITLRQGALMVLARHADRNDAAVRARGDALWKRLQAITDAAGANPRGGSVANAATVVGEMGRGFRRCYNQGLGEDPDMAGSIRVTAKIDAEGKVASATETHVGLSPTVVACVVARVRSGVFSPPEGGGATIVIPVTFKSEPPPPSQQRAAPSGPP